MSLTRSMSWPRRCLSSRGGAKSFGSTPLSDGLSRSMAAIASSTSVPIVGCGACAFRCCQRASCGTQKMLAARYSSGSSGSAPCALLGFELGVLRLEGVGDVLEEDQAEDDVLVLGRVHVVAQRVGGGPELLLEAQICRGGVLKGVRHWLLLRLGVDITLPGGDGRSVSRGGPLPGARRCDASPLRSERLFTYVRWCELVFPAATGDRWSDETYNSGASRSSRVRKRPDGVRSGTSGVRVSCGGSWCAGNDAVQAAAFVLLALVVA